MTARLPLPGAEARFLVTAAALVAAVLAVPALPGYWARPGLLSQALTVDLALGLPALAWLFLVRKGAAPATLLPPLFVAGLLLARWLVPGRELGDGRLVELLVVAVEGTILVYVGLRVRTVTRVFRARRAAGEPAPEALRAGLAGILNERVAAAAATEASVLWYATAGWRRPGPAPEGVRAFPLHGRNGYPAVLGALLLAVAAETAILHLLLHAWTPVAAWIATALSAWSAAWLVADFHAARHHPPTADEGGLSLRVGLRWSVRVAWEDVAGVSRSTAPVEDGLDLTLLGPPDLHLELRRAVEVQGPFGIRKSVSLLGLGAEDSAALQAAIEARLTTTAA